MSRNDGVFVGLGTNVGDRPDSIERAVDALDGRPDIRVIRQASLYETEPVGPVDQPWFLNTVVELDTGLGAEALLAQLKAIETDLGRIPRERWGPREIDLDLLLSGDSVIRTSELVVPHPELPKRRFVLVPLAELAPDLVHPELGQSLERLLRACVDEKGVRPFPRDPAKRPRKRFSSKDGTRLSGSASSNTDG